MSEPAEDNIKYLREVLIRCDAQMEGLEEKVFKLLNFYSVFLGVIIAAVAQVSFSASPWSSKCDQQPYFIAFSVVPFVIYGIPLIAMACEYVITKIRRDRFVTMYSSLRAGPSESEFERSWYREMIYKIGAGSAILFLAGFNVLVGYACHSMLCGNKNIVSSNGTCPQVCNKICATN